MLHVRLVVEDPVSLRCHDGDVTVGEADHRAGMLHDRAGVRSNEIFPVPDADQHRRAAPRDDDRPRFTFRNGRQAVRALDARQCRDDAFRQRGARGVLDQVRERFGVRLRLETMPGPLQANAQHVGVLDDAVVDERERTRAIGVGMGVAIGRCSVRGPARVPDAAAAVYRIAREQLAQAVEAARQFASLHAVAVQHRHAGGVVAPVLEARQTVEQQRCGVLRSDVRYDPTHRSRPLFLRCEQRFTGGCKAEAGEPACRLGARTHPDIRMPVETCLDFGRALPHFIAWTLTLTTVARHQDILGRKLHEVAVLQV